MNSDAAPGLPDATVTVLCQNEAPHLEACLASIARAGRGLRLVTTVIVNGSRDSSAIVARQASDMHGLDANIYAISHGDKANAINHGIAALRKPAALHVFVDAYAVLSDGALRALADALARDDHALAATGLAGNGRTMQAAAEATLREGGRLNGQLHAFRPAFLDRMVSAGIRLPVGLYRGDSLLASMVCHNLDALGQPWDNARCIGARDAVFTIPQLSPVRPRDIVRQFRRKVRQMRGRLENAAIQSIIYRGGYAALPDNADDMIAGWLAAGGRVKGGPFTALALRRHRRAGRPQAEDLVPVLQT
jgi:glycosyltransferase involved in cell wall biosynthesis